MIDDEYLTHLDEMTNDFDMDGFADDVHELVGDHRKVRAALREILNLIDPHGDGTCRSEQGDWFCSKEVRRWRAALDGGSE